MSAGRERSPGGPALDFLNEPGLVGDLGALRGLLQLHGPVPPHDPTPAERERLEALRRTLLAVAEIVAGGRLPSRHELADLNAFLSAAPVQLELGIASGRLVVESTPLTAGWETIVRELAGWFAALLVDHDPTRLKRCANPDCGRFFYDTSRSRTRRWHDESCGTLFRVRRFRDR